MMIELSEADEAELRRRFDYHPPTVEDRAKYEAITESTRAAARVILSTCPPGELRKAALDHLHNARMWANSSIACKGVV